MTTIASFSSRSHGASCSCCSARFGNSNPENTKPNMQTTLNAYQTSVDKMSDASNTLGILHQLTQQAEQLGIPRIPSDTIASAFEQTQTTLLQRLQRFFQLSNLTEKPLSENKLNKLANLAQTVAAQYDPAFTATA